MAIMTNERSSIGLRRGTVQLYSSDPPWVEGRLSFRIMDFDYPNLIGALSDEDRISFYEILAHNLTVSVRGIWSDENLTDSQKLEGMKYVNEIMHRVVMKAAYLRVQKNTMSESDSWADIKHWVSLCPEIDEPVEWAIKFSYKTCRHLALPDPVT